MKQNDNWKQKGDSVYMIAYGIYGSVKAEINPGYGEAELKIIHQDTDDVLYTCKTTMVSMKSIMALMSVAEILVDSL